MNEVKYLEEGYYEKNANQSVFVIIYSRKREKISKSIIREVPGFLTIFRSDGKLGLPGGRLEKKDLIDNSLSTNSLKNTAVRETREEIGYEIKNISNLKFESTLLLGKNQITTFSYLVSDTELNQIYKDYSSIIGGHFNSDEIYGLNRIYITNGNVKKNIFKQNFKMTTKEQIKSLLTKYF